jgi:hypothetical protein
MLYNTLLLSAPLLIAGHGAMVYPPPRSAHNQTLDARNRCGASDPYSKTNSQTSLGDGEYCGIGCLGEACLYYQIGCYAGCGTCSLTGKDLYPTQADLDLANNCKPIEPTLGGGDPVHERELRTHNVDSSSSMGDWTKVNPWRAPGTAGMGNPNFQPCGINSGGAASFSNPETTAKDVPKAGPGTALPKIGHGPVWTRGTTVEVSWAIYANHVRNAASLSLLAFACTVLRRKAPSRRPFPCSFTGRWLLVPHLQAERGRLGTDRGVLPAHTARLYWQPDRDPVHGPVQGVGHDPGRHDQRRHLP